MARDGQHSGVYSNKVFANKVAEDLKQKIDKQCYAYKRYNY